MIDDLFEKRLTKEFDKLAHEQAKLDEKKYDIAQKASREIDAETLERIFKIVSKYGHPNEKKDCERIKKEYQQGNNLTFEDYLELMALYKSNYKYFGEQ